MGISGGVTRLCTVGERIPQILQEEVFAGPCWDVPVSGMFLGCFSIRASCKLDIRIFLDIGVPAQYML